MGLFYKTSLFIGFFLLGHAAYSAGQYRSFLKLAEEDYNSLPSDIFLECILASLLCIVGVVLTLGDFRDIKMTTELNMKTYDSMSNRTSFMMFNHRGRMIHGAYDNDDDDDDDDDD